jgi:hypothetical protein
MKVRSEDAKYFSVSSSWSMAKEEKKGMRVKASAVSDSFSAEQAHKASSPFMRRQMVPIDPFVEIGEHAYSLAQKPWWDQSLIARLSRLAAPVHKQQSLNPDLIQALKNVAKDKSYLVVNWRDDTR